jgi:hypothetical protein
MPSNEKEGSVFGINSQSDGKKLRSGKRLVDPGDVIS